MTTPDRPGEAVLDSRVHGLLTFLREYVQRRLTPVRDVGQYDHLLWLTEMPSHGGAGTTLWGDTPPAFAGEEAWAWVPRPQEPVRPETPGALVHWLRFDPRDGGRSVPEPIEQREIDGLPVLFGEDQGRVAAYGRFEAAWTEWAHRFQEFEELRVAYERLFRLERYLEREGERVEARLCVGLLAWRRPGHSIRRHVLTIGATVRMDSTTGGMAVIPDVLSPVLQVEDEMLDINDRIPQPDVLEVEQSARAIEDPLDESGIRAALQPFVNALTADAVYEGEVDPMLRAEDRPVVRFAPALVVRRRGERSLVRVYESILGEVSEFGASPALRRLVGAETPVEIAEGERASSIGPAEDAPVLLPLEANREQLKIVEKLSNATGVVVEGPPGTGKSHTIANLMAHLLASGKRILVTSHTSRALEVLREKLPEEIRQLCVSVLSDSRGSQEQLRGSATAINARSSDFVPERDLAEVLRLEERRRTLLSERAIAYREAVALRQAESLPLIADGPYAGRPEEVGRALARDEDAHGWLGLTVTQEEPPLTNPEAAEYVSLVRSLAAKDREEAGLARPTVAHVPPPTTLEAALAERDDAQAALDLAIDEADAAQTSRSAAIATAKERHEQADAAVPRSDLAEGVELDRLMGLLGDLVKQVQAIPEDRYPWVPEELDAALRDRATDVAERATAARGMLETLDPQVEMVLGRELTGHDDRPVAGLLVQARTLRAHLAAGGRLKGLLGRPEPVKRADELLTHIRLDGLVPDTIETLDRVVAWFEVAEAVTRASRTWSGTAMDDNAATAVARLRRELALIDDLEQVRDLSAQIRTLAGPLMPSRSLDAEARAALATTLDRIARARQAEATARALEAEHAKLVAQDQDQAEAAKSHLAELTNQLAHVTEALRSLQGTIPPCSGDAHPAAAALQRALGERDLSSYSSAHAELVALEELARRIARCDELGERLRQAGAVAVIEALGAAPEAGDWDDRMGAFEEAWRWAAADTALRRISDPAHQRAVEARLVTVEEDLRTVTTELAAQKAWTGALARVTDRERQGLAAYAQAIGRLGKGTGKYAQKHIRDAQQHLDRCQTAVPAWIMPISRVAQTVQPVRDRFDVIVVDEASQAGIDALFLLHLAPRIVVVGDDQQISPDEVGVDRAEIDKLRASYLQGVEFGSELNPDSSLFAQADILFGDRVRLREHFRCMPEIIEFSNALCYRDLGQPLIPLRQFGTDRLPPLRAVFVPEGHRDGTGTHEVNRPEAERLVDQIVACIEDPAYVGKTMGVISLLASTGQARLIEDMLRERIPPAELSARRIRCGDAYAFQGDERDVIFLTMVAAKEPGRTMSTLTSEPQKRRFNVAASRARDQMWLFHSVMPADLNPVCLRHRLLTHFLTPQAGADTTGYDVDDDNLRPPFESIFEQRVYRRIRERGYEVVPQYRVNEYRIDLVVVGGTRKVAVECDGERFHGPERAEQDLGRQRDLERCGWTFFRVRGGAFFRDPEGAMAGLWPLLARLGVHPMGADGSRVAYDPAEVVPALESMAAATEFQDGNTTGDATWTAAPPSEPRTEHRLVAAEALSAEEDDSPACSEPAARPIHTVPAPPQDSLFGEPVPISVVDGSYPVFDADGAARDRAFPDPRITSSLLVAQGLEAIVAVEGPMKVERLYRLYVRASGHQRLTSQYRSALNKELARLQRGNRVVVDRESSGAAGYVDAVVRLPDQPAVSLRDRGPRSLEEIPRREVAGHASEILSRVNVSGESLQRAILERLGLVMLTQKTAAYLDEAVALVEGQPTGDQDHHG